MRADRPRVSLLAQAARLSCAPAERPRASASLHALVTFGLLWAGSSSLAQTRPAPNTLPKPATDVFVKRGDASVSVGTRQFGSGAAATTRDTLTVTTRSASTVLRWEHADLGSQAAWVFDQASNRARTLNVVVGPTGTATQRTMIDGLLQSNGQVYLYNPRGITFGKNAVVNVNALVASSLKLDEDQFMKGLLSPVTGNGPVFYTDPALGFTPGAVLVEGSQGAGVAQRAALTVAQNGMILLAAPQVVNQGLLSAPDGQVILAGGSRVYLAAPTDTSMRGLRVEIGAERLADLADADTGSSVSNAAGTGAIDVRRGNITMAALMVNQEGLASATTSANLNGSIILKAREVAAEAPNFDKLPTRRSGTVQLGDGSVTQVLPESPEFIEGLQSKDMDQAALPPAGPAFKPSRVDISGQTIQLGKDARVKVPGGQVTLKAQALLGNPSTTRNDSRVELGRGSVIDVSGSQARDWDEDRDLTVRKNLIEVELRGGELADNPLLRDNPAVRGQTVLLDTRKMPSTGVPTANVSGYLNQRQYKVDELTAQAGTVTIESEGRIVQDASSQILARGGAIHYAAGHVNTSKYVYNGRLYDIETASADLPYDGVVQTQAGVANLEAGYVEGRSAGKVSLTAPEMDLKGQFHADVVRGPYQRDMGSAAVPAGGEFSVRLGLFNDTAGRIVIGGTDVEADGALRLDVVRLNQQGFSTVSAVAVDGGITVDGDLRLVPGTRLSLTADGGHLHLGGDVLAHAGALTLRADAGRLTVADGLTIDVSGQWINDRIPGGATGLLSYKGGSVRLAAQQLDVGEDVTIDASGGAWLSAASKLTAGTGGSIALASVLRTNLEDSAIHLGDGLSLRGYGLTAGGSLSITAPSVRVTGQAGEGDLTSNGQLVLGLDSLAAAGGHTLSAGGFGAWQLAALGNLRIDAGARLTPRAASWQLDADYLTTPTGMIASVGSVSSLAGQALSGPGARTQTSHLTLSAADGVDSPRLGTGQLSMAAGAAIQVDPGSRVALRSAYQMAVDGHIVAPGGTIQLHVATPGDARQPTSSIWIGPQAQLRADGTADRLAVDAKGIASGEVLDGGRILIGLGTAGDPSTATLAPVVIEEGAVLSADGVRHGPARFRSGASVSDVADLSSAGGSIEVASRTGMVVAGDLSAQAGGSAAHGGSLAIYMARTIGAEPVELTLSARSLADVLDLLPQGWTPGTPETRWSSRGTVALDSLKDGGFMNVKLQSTDTLTFQGDDAGHLALAASGRLDLIASRFKAGTRDGLTTHVDLTAPYVSIGQTDARWQADGVAVDGAAGLSISARVLDLQGRSATEGFGLVALTASEAIRLNGVVAPNEVDRWGSWSTGHALTLKAPVLYPTTLSDFTLRLAGDDSVLRFEAAPGSSLMLLSAAGRIRAEADHIVQAGVLKAPFGRIELVADQSLSYLSGSVTSVAGDGIVPFGSVDSGTTWTYNVGTRTLTFSVDPSTDADALERLLPGKAIVSDAPVIQQQAGATLDASGGGSLLGYEFLPGPGGSTDVLLAQGDNLLQKFAIHRDHRGSVAPVDAHLGDKGLKVGDQVYLSGGHGVEAGYYTLLPAHYALLDGGMAIELQAGARDMVAAANHVKADQSIVMAGYRHSSLDGRSDTRWQGFKLSPRDLILKRSEFKLYDSDSFFDSQAARLGVESEGRQRDGGHLSFLARNTLSLAGRNLLAGRSGPQGAAGQAGALDLAAPLLAVVAARSARPGDYVEVTADEIGRVGAASVLLGGTRSVGGERMSIDVVSDLLRIDTDGAHALEAPDLLMVASDAIQVSDRSVLRATGATAASMGDVDIVGEGASADGAALHLGSSRGMVLNRDDAVGRRGRLEIGQRATLAGAYVDLNASAEIQYDVGQGLSAGAALSLQTRDIDLGATSTATTGLRLDTADLDRLNQLGAIGLVASNEIRFHGSVELGSRSTRALTLQASRIRGVGQGTTLLSADRVELQGATRDLSAGVAGTQGLSVAAGTLRFGEGKLALDGFSNTTLQARDAIVLGAQSGRLSVGGDLALQSPRVRADRGAAQALQASGDVRLSSTADRSTTTVAGLGGKLLVDGASVVSTARLELPSGEVELRGRHGVSVDGGTVDVSGRSQAFGSGAVHTPAGTITLDGGDVHVVVAAGATLDLSAREAAAGTLKIKTSGGDSRVDLRGQILASASTSGIGTGNAPAQGRFIMDVANAQTAQDFAAMNDLLNRAGMTQERRIHAQRGDLVVQQGQLIQARQVHLSTDDGNIQVAGTLDARGASGGQIELFATDGEASTAPAGRIVLTDTAVLRAQATTAATQAAGSVGDGGRVVMGVARADGGAVASVSSGASVSVSGGAQIDVRGLGAGTGGDVIVRAPRVGEGAGFDVAVARFGVTVRGADKIVIEGVRTYHAETISGLPDSATQLDASDRGRMAREADSFMRNADAVARRLGRQDVQLTPGIEVRSTGDLTVSVNEQAVDLGDRGWDLSTWRFGGRAGTLTLRAAGNLHVLGSISDGFVRPRTTAGDELANVAMPNWDLSSDEVSWSLQLVAGAQLASADALQLADQQSASLRLGFADTPTDSYTPVSMVRTGTGRIDLAASGDVVFERATLADPDGDRSADLHFGASVYTGGRSQAAGAAFVAPVNADNPLYGPGGVSAAAFGADGGDITLIAGGDVLGAAVPQLVNNWLFRQGRATTDASGQSRFDTVSNSKVQSTAWWVRTDQFNQSLGTLGGGDITVDAGGSVVDLSVSAPTQAFTLGVLPATAVLSEHGGGDVVVRASQDILGGSFYVQKGDLSLSAQGAIKAGTLSRVDIDINTESDVDIFTALRPVLALGDTRVRVTAGRDVEIETAYNPTLAPQASANARSVSSLGNAIEIARTDQLSTYSTYAADAALDILSVGGDALMSGNLGLVGALGGNNLLMTGSNLELRSMLGYLPPSVSVAAPSGSIDVVKGFVLAPSAQGQLDLLAARDITFGSVAYSFNGVRMLDNDPARVASPALPRLLTPADLAVVAGTSTSLDAHTAALLHGGDADPARLIALEGDIVAPEGVRTALSLAKKAEIMAGRDVRDLSYSIQHNHAGDVTRIVAGRDIVDTTNYTTDSETRHVVTGPGLLTLQAGRDIDLANSQGVVTRGNLENPYLPEGGASIVAVAGAPIQHAGHASNPFDLLAQTDDLFEALVLSAKYDTLAGLMDRTRTLGEQNPYVLLEFNALLVKSFPSLFDGLDVPAYGADVQAVLSQNVAGARAKLGEFDTLFKRILPADGASAGSSQTLSVAMFDHALRATFPGIYGPGTAAPSQTVSDRSVAEGSRLGSFDRLYEAAFGAQPGAGNISLVGSQFKTEQGGSLTLMAPGGSVLAGLVSLPSYVSKASSNLGIFTIGGGEVQIAVGNNLQVNQGRIFTLGGGDITLVSQAGDIDAGRGRKTASSAPPPLLKVDAAGNVQLDISGSVAGSGIGTLTTGEGQVASDVYAVAPRGAFDAGDAGVRSSGSVSLTAKVVLNAANIQSSGGVSSSVVAAPSMDTAGPPPSAGNTAEEAAKQLSSAPKDTLSLTVEVLGFGDEADEEGEDDEERRKRKARKS